MPKILFISTNNIGNGLSGGDRIFLELARHWSDKLDITILGAQETFYLTNKYHVSTNQILIDSHDSSPILFHQIRRLIKSLIFILFHLGTFSQFDYFYSVSDFYPDFFPGLLLKMLFPKKKWITGYYLNAPNPFNPSSPYNHTNQTAKGAFYFLSQIPVKLLINLYADIVYITSEPDKKFFPNKKVIIIRGGVDISESESYLHQSPKIKKVFDAVFVGRLHPQKGIIELVDIWKLVTLIKPDSKLAIVGDGGLEIQLKRKIIKCRLQDNITLFGFLDGQAKYSIFKQSRLVVHPAVYDSGGMAAAEAMAWGLPGISFDLESLKTYYPQGVVKVPLYDYQRFADQIIKLLSDRVLYHRLSIEAITLIRQFWSWPHQSLRIIKETGFRIKKKTILHN